MFERKCCGVVKKDDNNLIRMLNGYRNRSFEFPSQGKWMNAFIDLVFKNLSNANGDPNLLYNLVAKEIQSLFLQPEFNSNEFKILLSPCILDLHHQCFFDSRANYTFDMLDKAIQAVFKELFLNERVVNAFMRSKEVVFNAQYANYVKQFNNHNDILFTYYFLKANMPFDDKIFQAALCRPDASCLIAVLYHLDLHKNLSSNNIKIILNNSSLNLKGLKGLINALNHMEKLNIFNETLCTLLSCDSVEHTHAAIVMLNTAGLLNRDIIKTLVNREFACKINGLHDRNELTYTNVTALEEKYKQDFSRKRLREEPVCEISDADTEVVVLSTPR